MQLHISLSIEQENQLWKWVGEINSGHWQADMEPPGYDLILEGLGCPYGVEATAVCGNQRLPLGEVVAQWSTPQ